MRGLPNLSRCRLSGLSRPWRERHDDIAIAIPGSEVGVKVKDLSEEQLAILIRRAVEDALHDFLGANDPDEGLDLRAEVRERLVSSARRVAAGERGRSLDDVV